MSQSKTERVAILGASDKPDRYSHRAQLMLRQRGHEVVPVNPKLEVIEGIPVVPDLGAIEGAVDTLTLYVGPQITSGLADAILALKPRRVIFNPGTENPALEARLSAAGISCDNACTLVLLTTGTF